MRKTTCFLGSILMLIVFSMESQAQQSLADLKNQQKKIKAAVETVMPATVSITDGTGFGSGVVVTNDGYILTAGHVLTTNPRNRDLTVYFPDGSRAKARPLGKNLTVDAGMCKLIGDRQWPYVEIGDSKSVKRGDWCITIGHSGGYELGRTPPVRIGKILRNNNRRMITDCALIGGDSGGPLFDIDGKLIGIHSSIGRSIAENRHAAIDPFLEDWDKLADGKTWGKLGAPNPNRAFLGIRMSEDKARVEEVIPKSAAMAAGVEVGDVVIKIDENQINGAADLVEAIADKQPGSEIRLRILRQNKSILLTAQLKSLAEMESE
jgi:serine protease Do